MMFSIVDEIAMKHYDAPSNLNVEEVSMLFKAISDAEIASDDQYLITRKYRVALEEIYGIAVEGNLPEIKEIIDGVLNDD